MIHAARLFFEALGIATFALTVFFLAVGCVAEFRHWRAHRHDERDEFGNYLDALRDPGMGDLRVVPPNATVYSDQPGGWYVVKGQDVPRVGRTR